MFEIKFYEASDNFPCLILHDGPGDCEWKTQSSVHLYIYSCMLGSDSGAGMKLQVIIMLTFRATTQQINNAIHLK